MPKTGSKIPRPKPKQKVRRETQPNLPQHDLSPPYAILQTLGSNEDEQAYEDVAAQIRSRDLEAGMAQLLRMALDESYYEYLDEDTAFMDINLADVRAYTRVHAVRTLIRLADAAQTAIEPLLPLLDEDDDWLREEMPFFYAAVGSPAIEPLSTLLFDTQAETFARGGASESLAEMAEKHPELRPQILQLLERALQDEPEDETLRGLVIMNLMDIGALESLPLIEQAFAEGRVDSMMVQLSDVQEHFHLPVTMPRVRLWLEPDESPDADDENEKTDELDGPDTSVPGGRVSEFKAPPQTPYVAPPKVGRNEPCPCGSGKKYKKCCGA